VCGGGGGKVLLGRLNRLGAQGSGCGDAMCAECQHVTAGLGAYDVPWCSAFTHGSSLLCEEPFSSDILSFSVFLSLCCFPVWPAGGCQACSGEQCVTVGHTQDGAGACNATSVSAAGGLFKLFGDLEVVQG
jgi:hypothetical protein